MAVIQDAEQTLPSRRGRPWFGGGPDGNEKLTAIAGVLLLVLFAVLGVTIIRIGQLLWLHLFLGLLLIGPVALKLASTGYRFARYYLATAAYRLKGPPHPLLRGLAPFLVASTAAVFATGILLLVDGPGSRDQLLLWHKVSFIAWLVAMAPHVLGHLVELPPALHLTPATGHTSARATGGGTGRAIALISAIVAGAVLAIVLLPDFGSWTAAAAHFHHHHDG
ncbi:MAG: hypothetical protein ACXVUE_03175 [Solirubrobacteraceae bacterium]